MNEIKFNEYRIVFTFKNGNDLIGYITERECTDLKIMIDYSFSLVQKYGYKYGDIIEIEIYRKIDDTYFSVYDNVMLD